MRRFFRVRWWVALHGTGKGVPLLIRKRTPLPPLVTIFYNLYGPYSGLEAAKRKMEMILLKQGNAKKDIDWYLGQPTKSLLF